ncbi:protealysin inhibitor emfourin [Microlunatus sp. Gsoil 973]|uniref:protealysin inhibitor emfourin n=1 Tax=Microlunatus sp. Gsoil 973 TaxID=2672569 RepID=UPI0012B4F029|nr:protealysin inhibitor emfourin [Microlunatus sp. Gsoil 973]QGN34831.1 M4 family peptidase [Microlunatus sp. Gsoil 973]
MTCSIIPSYLLRRIAETAERTPHPCENTLRVDDRIRRGRPRRPEAAGMSSDQPGPRSIAPETITQQADAKRQIYTADNTENLPGTLARRDTDPETGDAAVDEAWTSSAQIWDLYADVFDRESVDGRGSTVTVTVHYGQDYDNAFWDGSQLVFGDGDGEIFERFTKPMDVMGHEFTHGVTEDSAGLSYDGQPGALNESISDVFASICKQRVNQEAAEEADWLIGAGLFAPGVNARALRSMKEPGTAYDDPRLGKDPQVASMADYVDTTDDNGGVHINSGIPNHAFYLAATKLGGNSWEQAGPIWYQALTGGAVSTDTDFAGFATATVKAAEALYPDSPSVAQSISEAWAEVGVLGKTDDTNRPPRPRSRTVAISRSGGFAGVTRTAEVDLDSDVGRRISQLLDRVDFDDFTPAAPTPGRPDRFVYRLSYGDLQLTVGEQDVPPELGEAIKIAFSRSPGSGPVPGEQAGPAAGNAQRRQPPGVGTSLGR